MFYGVFSLAGTSAVCLIIGLLKREYEPMDETQEELSDFQLGKENPAIRKRVSETQSVENSDLSTSQVPELETSQIEEKWEDAENWGKNFREENLETKAEKREDKNAPNLTQSSSPILSPEETPSPSPPAQKPEEKKPETPFKLVNQVLEVELTDDVSTTTAEGKTPIKLKKGQKIKVVVQGVKVDEEGNIVSKGTEFEIPELTEETKEKDDFGGVE